jgi:hypothetical protein
MHHGYYPEGCPPKSNQQAQIDMIEESLRFAGVERVSKVPSQKLGWGGCAGRQTGMATLRASLLAGLSAAVAFLCSRCPTDTQASPLKRRKALA